MPDPIDTTTPLNVSSSGEGAAKPPAPAGTFQVVCVFAEDLGEAVSNYPGSPPKLVRKVLIGWELSEKMDDGRPYMLSKEFTASLHDKSKLGPFLANWRGRPFTDAEKDKFNLRSLIGVNGLASVVHKPKKAGGMRADILSVSPLMKGMEAIKPFNTTLPDWIADRKLRNKEDVARFLAGTSHGDAEADGPEGFDGLDPNAGGTEGVPF